MQSIWNERVQIDSLGAMPKQLGKRIKDIGITAEIGQLQETVLLGTVRIL